MPGFFSIILPVEKRNLLANPSLELGTAGWGTFTSCTFGTTAAIQAFGVMAGSAVPGANGTSGVRSPSVTVGIGTPYAYSFYGSFPLGSTYIIGAGDSGGNNIQGTFVGTGYGAWFRYVGSWTEASTTLRMIAIRKNNNVATDTFYIDAAQIEVGSVTTYLDGDQPGCLWDGAAQASASLRPASVRTGGTLVNLNDIGVIVMESPGMGMPDVEVITQDYAYLDGGFYQRTRATQRTMTLISLMTGTTWQHFQSLRRAYINAVRPDVTATPQPYRIYYTGVGGTLTLDCVYEAGLGYSEREGFAETTGVRMIGVDPYWKSELERGTTLPAQVSMGSTTIFAYRDPYGRWGTLGQNGTTGNAGGYVLSMDLSPNGTLAFGGAIGTIGGTANSRWAGFYAGGTFGTFPSNPIDNIVEAVSWGPSGTLYLGGHFTASIAARYLTQFSAGAWGSVADGTLNNLVTSILPYGGSVFVAGVFSHAGPNSAGSNPFFALNNNTTWGTTAGGTLNAGGLELASLSNSIVVISAATQAGGTTMRPYTPLIWNNNGFGTVPGTVTKHASIITRTVAVTPGQQIIVGGYFSGVNGGSASSGVYQSNGISISSMGLGLGSGSALGVEAVAVSPSGRLWAGGIFRSTGTVTPFPDGLAQWTGAAWIPGDIDLPGVGGSVYAIEFAPDGGMYIAGDFSGIGTAASVTTINTPSSAETYPRIVMTAPSSGTARVFQLINTLTGDAIYFDLAIQPTERVILNLQPGSVSFTSSYRGNLINTILPGSNLSKWRLLAGTNYVSFFADNPNLRTDLIYRPRFWSSDGTA